MTKGRSRFNSLFASNETRWGRSEDRSAIVIQAHTLNYQGLGEAIGKKSGGGLVGN
ncbi:hypothetical protein [Microcoleus sp. S36b_A2]|uniref:hypothetical protein n=1 Tax=Microcoleus sp. S36b_A2 TaxID=3055418 RepID=UPI002FCE85B5